MSAYPSLTSHKPTYSIGEVAKLLGCSHGLVNRLIDDNQLTAFRLGDSLRKMIVAEEITR